MGKIWRIITSGLKWITSNNRLEFLISLFLILNLIILTISSYQIYKLISFMSAQAEKQNLVELAQYIEPEFKPYVDSFIKNARNYGIELEGELAQYQIKFNDIPSLKAKKKKNKQVAWCVYFTKVIAIDKAYWTKSDNNHRQAILDHELGHCLLGRLHINKTIKTANNEVIPKSAMSKFLVDGKIYSENKDYYREEMFSDKSKFGKLKDALNKKMELDDISSGTASSRLTE